MNKVDLPLRLKVFTCSMCGVFLGIEDVARIRHEHFDEIQRCRHAHMVRSFYNRDDQTNRCNKDGPVAHLVCVEHGVVHNERTDA